MFALDLPNYLSHCLVTCEEMLHFPCFRPFLGFPGGSDGKESACNEGDLGSIPGLGRSPGGGHGNPLHILAWRIPMDRRAWQATVHGVLKEWDVTE